MDFIVSNFNQYSDHAPVHACIATRLDNQYKPASDIAIDRNLYKPRVSMRWKEENNLEYTNSLLHHIDKLNDFINKTDFSDQHNTDISVNNFIEILKSAFSPYCDIYIQAEFKGTGI